VQAVSKWKFRPGKKGGRNVNTKMQVPIVFSITEE
jgi:protein TonB